MLADLVLGKFFASRVCFGTIVILSNHSCDPFRIGRRLTAGIEPDPLVGCFIRIQRQSLFYELGNVLVANPAFASVFGYSWHSRNGRMSTVAQPKGLEAINKRSRQAEAPHLNAKSLNRFPAHHHVKACFTVRSSHAAHERIPRYSQVPSRYMWDGLIITSYPFVV